MKRGKKIAILVLAISFCSLFFPTLSRSASCLESLKDLKGVEVLVEELKPELEDFNLTMIEVQADVESKLRNAGIEVLSREDNEKIQPLRKPYLYVKINSLKLPWRRASFAFHVEIALKQQVKLSEHPKDFKKSFYAPTWNTNFMGTVSGSNVPEIRDSVKGLMDQFVNDYLKENLK